MRPGRLRTLATLVRLSDSLLVPVEVGQRWIGVTVPEASEEPALLQGLLTRRNLMVRAHYEAFIYPGMYWRTADALLLVDSVRDPDGRRADLVMSCTELRGRAALYQSLAGPAFTLRAALSRDLVYAGELGRVAESRVVIEVPRIELPVNPVRGDTLRLDGKTWRVQGLPEGGDDGIVLRLAVLP